MRIRRLAALTVAALALFACTATTGRAADIDKALIPGDADLVVVANYQQLISSPLFKKHGMEPFKQVLQDPQLKPAFEAVGLDPLRDIDTILVCTGGKLDGTDKLFIAVKGRFDADNIDAAARNEKLKVHQQGGLKIYEVPIKTDDKKAPDTAFVTLTDKTTAVLATKKDYLTDVLAGKVKPGKNAAELKAALDRANPRDTIRAALVLTDDLKAELKALPQLANHAASLQSITASVNVGGDAQIDLMINTPTPPPPAR